MEHIGYIQSDFKEKFGIPRQSGRTGLLSRVVFYPKFRNPEALRGIENFSHLWLIFDFSKSHKTEFSPTVRPPRLGGNERVGVFASRSPFRPNPIGLSCVKLVRVEKHPEHGLTLLVSGADLLDGTPLFDIKPYIPYADCQTDAVGSYADMHQNDKLKVIFQEGLLEKLPAEKRAGLTECLADDPRPSYQDDPNRVYGMRFAEFNLKFKVANGVLTVEEIEPLGS